MRKLFFLCCLVAIVALSAACDNSEGKTCRITGVAPDSFMEGQWVFLVPFSNATRANVDSTVIKDGRFEFHTDTMMIAKLLTAFRLQLDVQPLLVVVEPGDVEVTIASISSAKGTPQNDSLQHWKELTERHNSEMSAFRKANDRVAADSAQTVYIKRTRQLADNLRQGVLYDFLNQILPKAKE